MSSTLGESSLVAFRRAVDALCLSRVDIARNLGIDAAALESLVQGASPVPAGMNLALVDLLKAHEVTLEQAAGALFEHAMRGLTREGHAPPASAVPDPLRARPPPAQWVARAGRGRCAAPAHGRHPPPLATRSDGHDRPRSVYSLAAGAAESWLVPPGLPRSNRVVLATNSPRASAASDVGPPGRV